MYTDFLEIKPEPRRHRRTSAIVAMTAGLAVAFAGGWAIAPHDGEQVTQVAPLAAPAAAPIEPASKRCMPRPTPPYNVARRLQPMSADATEAWLSAPRHRRATH